MSDVNTIVMTGRLTRDNELKYTAGGTAVLSFGMASNRVWFKDNNKQEEVVYIEVTVWGQRAESYSKHLMKGKRVAVEGRLKLDQWEGDGGVKRSRHTIVAEKVNFLESKRTEPTAVAATANDVPFDSDEPEVEFDKDF